MKPASFLKIIASQAIVIVSFFLVTACDVNTGTGDGATCAAQTAEIQVQNGSMIRVCGCTEGSGQSFSDGSVLQCTIPAGTHVYFSFVGTTNTREITVQGISPCPIAYPSQSTTTCVIDMNYSGTFRVSDLYDTSLNGSLIVQ